MTAFTSSAADLPRLRLDASAAKIAPGQTVTLTLSLTAPLDDVGSLEAHLLYDADALTLLDVTAGGANDALQPIRPTDGRSYTGVLFVYDYGTDTHADCRLAAGTLLTATFAVRDDAKRGSATLRVECAAALDTAFRPLALQSDASLDLAICRPAVSIIHYVPETTVDYRTTLTLRAETVDPLEGGEICWIVNGAESGTGSEYTLGPLRGDTQVQLQYRMHGRTLAVSEVERITVRAGLLARLVAFFRALFGLLPVATQSMQ